MSAWPQTLRRAMLSGTVASLSSTLALGLLARAAGKGALQPVNSTSHWLNGEAAASVRRADLRHTGVGYATHHVATLFWAVPFERWLLHRRPVAPLPMLRDALVLSAIAAATDYVATPRRFTPGWEFVLPVRSMALVYGAMAVGMAAGALLRQSSDPA